MSEPKSSLQQGGGGTLQCCYCHKEQQLPENELSDKGYIVLFHTVKRLSEFILIYSDIVHEHSFRQTLKSLLMVFRICLLCFLAEYP